MKNSYSCSWGIVLETNLALDTNYKGMIEVILILGTYDFLEMDAL